MIDLLESIDGDCFTAADCILDILFNDDDWITDDRLWEITFSVMKDVFRGRSLPKLSRWDGFQILPDIIKHFNAEKKRLYEEYAEDERQEYMDELGLDTDDDSDDDPDSENDN